MKRAGLLAIACIAAASAQPRITNAKLESRAFQGGVDQFKSLFASQAQPAWIGYAVPIVPGERNSCCYYSSNGRSWLGCNLEPGDKGTPPPGPTGPIRLEASKDLHVLYRVENGRVGKLRSFTGDCDLDAGGLPVVWLTGVRPADSLALLDTFSDRDAAIAAISLHSDPGADAYLEKYIAPDRPDSIRRRVSFWLGSARGRRGYELLKQLLSDEKQGDRVREHALHGLSVSKEPDALRLLIEMARSDRSSGVRSQALFWLAQKGAKDAVPTIRGAVDNDPEFRVKERAVFALSQLPKDEGVPLLIEVARNHRNPEVRKKAMFWLGQSKDVRAAKFFEELLLR